MTLEQRLTAARTACEKALHGPLLSARSFLADHGMDDAAIGKKLSLVADTQQIPAEFESLKQEFSTVLPAEEADMALERAMLVTTARRAVDTVPSQPVDDSVKHLFCKEILSFAQPPPASLERFSLKHFPFVAMSKIVTFRRFPAGQTQWEISGLPRSFLLKTPPRQLPATLWFTLAHMKGRAPYFVCHLAATVVPLRLLTERELLKTFCRLALAIELQPHIKGVMAGSWLHSRETHRVSPHLAFLNVPYLASGGHYFDAGPAKELDGFLAGDPHRAELYRSGKYKPTFGVVLVSRDQIIQWRRDHEDIVSTLAVR